MPRTARPCHSDLRQWKAQNAHLEKLGPCADHTSKDGHATGRRADATLGTHKYRASKKHVSKENSTTPRDGRHGEEIEEDPVASSVCEGSWTVPARRKIFQGTRPMGSRRVPAWSPWDPSSREVQTLISPSANYVREGAFRKGFLVSSGAGSCGGGYSSRFVSRLRGLISWSRLALRVHAVQVSSVPVW